MFGCSQEKKESTLKNVVYTHQNAIASLYARPGETNQYRWPLANNLTMIMQHCRA